MRLLAVLDWAKQIGFTDLFDDIFEFGSGPGSLQIAAHHSGFKWNWTALEASTEAKNIHKSFVQKFNMLPTKFTNKWSAQANTLFASSYVLNETDLPTEAFLHDSILIVEPSTQSASRKLMELRQKLIDRGYFIWGPCTHQEKCPLLEHSKKDWCHFRVHWDPPEWFKELEKQLPMKNRTLTLSCLMASKKPGPKFNLERPARIIGDTLSEKGKTRQALCRGSNREFLSWLKRHGEAQPYLSGELIELPESITIKGNELRMNTPDERN